MRVGNEPLLAEFRRRPCDECGRRQPSEAAKGHVPPTACALALQERLP